MAMVLKSGEWIVDRGSARGFKNPWGKVVYSGEKKNNSGEAEILTH